jgi:Holliday junction resolvase RusA-like endonuclease
VTSATFPITPVAKPRMTQSDRWRQRPAVMRYWAFKDCLQCEAERAGFELGPAFEVTFHLPMPQSWSKAKKQRMNGQPHQGRPDLDNLCKGAIDCLLPNDDSVIWFTEARKVWALEGAITIRNIEAALQ